MKTIFWMLGLFSGLLHAGCPDFGNCSQSLVAKLDRFDDSHPRKAAQKLLDVFRSDREESSVQVLGLRNHADARDVRLGDSLPKLELDCRELLAYDSAKTPDFQSLTGERVVMYRVMEDSLGTARPRSFVALRQLGPKETSGNPGHWRPLLAGAAFLLGKIDTTLDSLVPPESRPGAMIIMTPALGKVFIGYEAQGIQYLAPVRLTPYQDTSCIQWSGKGVLPARKVFAQIAQCYAPEVETLCADPRQTLQ